MKNRTTHSLAALVAGLALVAALAVPANAGSSFDRHFSVYVHYVGGHETRHGFTFRAVLLNPANPSNRVGRGHARCRVPNKPRCRVVFHLDGTIGGFGDLVAKGNFGHGDQTLNIVDGDGSFGGGIAGKVHFRAVGDQIDRTHFDLTR